MKKLLLLVCATVSQFCGALFLHGNEPIELDLLIVHTSAVTSNHGDASGVVSHAMASTTSVNNALENSEIPVSFNLVAVEEISYTESNTSLSVDLKAIAGKPDDGDPVDPAHAEVLDLRDKHGADLVTLFRDGPAGGAAGLAFILTPANDSEDFGYAVVSDESALSNLTLAHELGHNMASAHGRGESGSDPQVDEARGYKFSAKGTDYRTIMSIDSDFTRIPHFSNPNIFFEGVATGLPVGDPDAADNASAFAVSTPVIADFRRTQTETPSFLEEPVGDTLVSGGDSRLRALLRGLPPLTVEWFEGEVGDTSQPLASTETELARGGTESIIDVTGIIQTTQYWLRVTNPNDTLESRNFKVVLVPAPTGSAPLVEQAIKDGSTPVTFGSEQEMNVPEAAYLDLIEIHLSRQGNPPNPATVRFEEIGGELIFEQQLSNAQLDPFPATTPIQFTLGLFVAPDTEYRITVTPGVGQEISNSIIWDYAEKENVIDPNVGESNFVSERRLMFSLLGTETWTYHTWLETTQPPDASAGLQPSDETGGLPNLIRYALGGDFATPAAELRPQLQPLASTPEGTEAALRFTQRPALIDVEFIVEQSGDLNTWTPVDSSAVHALDPTPEGDDAFEVRVPYQGDRLFLRLNTEHPPAP